MYDVKTDRLIRQGYCPRMFDELAPEMGCKMVDCKKICSESSNGLTCIGLRFTTEAMAKECHLLSQLSADGIWLTVHQHRQKRGICADADLRSTHQQWHTGAADLLDALYTLPEAVTRKLAVITLTQALYILLFLLYHGT